MNWKAVPYKPRKHPAILRDAPLFSNAIHNRDYKKAAQLVVRTALEVLGVKGLMRSMENAMWFIERVKHRNGETPNDK